MRHIPIQGITFSELQSRLAISNKGLNLWLTRLGKWWGYIENVELDRGGSSKRINPRAVILPTAGGKKAIGVWQTLIPTIEARWRGRFGNPSVDALEKGLKRLVGQLDPLAPAYFPVLEYEDHESRAARSRLPSRDYVLPELLVKVLLAFAAAFDAQSQASLPLCANLLRVTPDSGIRIRDLPRLTCLSVDGTKDALRQIAREGLGIVRPESSRSRLRVLALTPKARLARDGYFSLAVGIEDDWKKRFGEVTVTQLRRSLESIVQGRGETSSALLRALTPYPDGWRAQLPPIHGLPHFPMESHRGGFPDGS